MLTPLNFIHGKMKRQWSGKMEKPEFHDFIRIYYFINLAISTKTPRGLFWMNVGGDDNTWVTQVTFSCGLISLCHCPLDNWPFSCRTCRGRRYKIVIFMTQRPPATLRGHNFGKVKNWWISLRSSFLLLTIDQNNLVSYLVS